RRGGASGQKEQSAPGDPGGDGPVDRVQQRGATVGLPRPPQGIGAGQEDEEENGWHQRGKTRRQGDKEKDWSILPVSFSRSPPADEARLERVGQVAMFGQDADGVAVLATRTARDRAVENPAVALVRAVMTHWYRAGMSNFAQGIDGA